MSSQEIHNITTVINSLVSIKWALICIAVSLWGLTVFFLLKEIPIWWKSFDKNKKCEGDKCDKWPKLQEAKSNWNPPTYSWSYNFSDPCTTDEKEIENSTKEWLDKHDKTSENGGV